MIAVLIIAGLVMLTAGAELVVRGGTRLAGLIGVSPLVVGLTVVALGTSAPELAVGIDSARAGVGDLALGNVAGTNVVNTLFILGLTAAIRPLTIRTRVMRIDLPAMVAASVALFLLSLDGDLSPFDGFVLLTGAAVYTGIILVTSRSEDPEVAEELGAEYDLPEGIDSRRDRVLAGARSGTMVVIGLVVIVLGADWLVEGSVDAAQALGVSDVFIGLTVVAIGTSAPELATTVVATVRGERDIAVGNLFGSSVFNILAILGVTAVAAPGGLEVSSAILWFDLPVLICISLLCVPVFMTGRRVSRGEGIGFVALYGIYLTIVLLTRT